VKVQSLAVKLQQDVRECHAPFLPDGGASWQERRMQGTSGMRANVTLEHSCTTSINTCWLSIVAKSLLQSAR